MTNQDNEPVENKIAFERWWDIQPNMTSLKKHTWDCWDAAQEQQHQTLLELQARKDDAYLERNRLVAVLAKLFPSGIKKTNIEGWSPDWHGCVYIDLPCGQVSWHYHDSHAFLFDGLPAYEGEWDGTTTEEKYKLLETFTGDIALKARIAELEEAIKRHVKAELWMAEDTPSWLKAAKEHNESVEALRKLVEE